MLNVEDSVHSGKVSPAKVPAVGAEERLKQLGISLPPPPTAFGRVGGNLTEEVSREAAELVCLSALSAVGAYLGSLDRISGIVKLGVYIATEGDFRDHPRLADGAFEILLKVFGEDKLSGHVVLGVPIEIELVLEAAS